MPTHHRLNAEPKLNIWLIRQMVCVVPMTESAHRHQSVSDSQEALDDETGSQSQKFARCLPHGTSAESPRISKEARALFQSKQRRNIGYIETIVSADPLLLVLADSDSPKALDNARGQIFEEFVGRLLEADGYQEPGRELTNVTSNGGLALDLSPGNRLTALRAIAIFRPPTRAPTWQEGPTPGSRPPRATLAA
jgi:hypothetical protein